MPARASRAPSWPSGAANCTLRTLQGQAETRLVKKCKNIDFSLVFLGFCRVGVPLEQLLGVKVAVLNAKLAVLSAKLAVLGAKLAVLGAELLVLGAKLAVLGAKWAGRGQF